MSLLRVDRVSRSFGGVRAVQEVSFSLGAGEVVALIGPNGAGKSTLFNLIDGQLDPDQGAIEFDGKILRSQATAQRTRLGIGRTFQVAQTFPSMTVVENVQLALVAAQRAASSVGAPLLRRQIEAARARLDQAGLADRSSDAAASLAYGDVKRLELVLALAGEPRLLLMDEPTAGMASGERSALMDLVVRLARERQLAVLFTEHSMDVVFGFAARVLVLSNGRLIADGTTEHVRNDPEVQAVYLGVET
jgi:ABC-type branched-subunit amino acid transport system ATPase component